MYNKTMKLSVLEGALYTLAFNATQGFVYSTLALYYDFDPLLVSVLAVLPATSQLIQFLTPMIYKLIPSKQKAIFWLALIARTGFIVLPISIIGRIRNDIIVAVPFVLFSVLNSLVGSLWTSAMKNIVPEEQRNRYFGMRNTIATFAGLIAWVLYSLILQYFERELALLLIYSVSSVIFIVTAYLLYLHDIPETKVAEYSLLMPLGTLRNKKFRNFLLFVFIWNFAIQFAGPFFSYFEVSQLKVPYSYLGVLNVVNSVLAMFFYTFYGKVTSNIGEKNMIRYGITLALGIPFLYSIMTPSNYKYLLLIDVTVAAMAWSAINLAYFTLLLRIVDEPSEVYISMHAFVAGVASLIASLAGGFTLKAIRDVTIGNLTGYNIMFMLAFILRLAALIYFIKMDIGESHRPLKFSEISQIFLRRHKE
ncbi:MAG: MFS transporter [Fervidobacterium sp.]|uniref:Na+/melibiose symporter n=1 Tax=Fervidobacterium gondwanense DSM 13020 TaxID=1121883 RepID=A0A1M7S5L2_FERGO|nr:MFS transporter [Fervidobacterium gondwanense]UXF00828.1 MFS transporter [Fervidobacterium riparium]SHN53615.1 Na+/melibiose symporter [Fervidobacterium gondwanense DSM 13020]